MTDACLSVQGFVCSDLSGMMRGRHFCTPTLELANNERHTTGNSGLISLYCIFQCVEVSGTRPVTARKVANTVHFCGYKHCPSRLTDREKGQASVVAGDYAFIGRDVYMKVRPSALGRRKPASTGLTVVLLKGSRDKLHL